MGYRLDRPKACPPEIYDLMWRCWIAVSVHSLPLHLFPPPPLPPLPPPPLPPPLSLLSPPPPPSSSPSPPSPLSPPPPPPPPSPPLPIIYLLSLSSPQNSDDRPSFLVLHESLTQLVGDDYSESVD